MNGSGAYTYVHTYVQMQLMKACIVETSCSQLLLSELAIRNVCICTVCMLKFNSPVCYCKRVIVTCLFALYLRKHGCHYCGICHCCRSDHFLRFNHRFGVHSGGAKTIENQENASLL